MRRVVLKVIRWMGKIRVNWLLISLAVRWRTTIKEVFNRAKTSRVKVVVPRSRSQLTWGLVINSTINR